MRARIFINEMRSGAVARDYLRLVKGGLVRPTQEAKEPSRVEAWGILETNQDQNQSDVLDVSIEGKSLITQMDHDLADFGLIPYWYSDLARSRGEAIRPGVRVIISGDPLRQGFETVEVSFEQESVRMRDSRGQEFVVPWDLVMPAEGREKDRPYWFTAQARDRGESLEIGDYVRVVGLEDKYELMDIFWAHGHVQIRGVGSDEYLGMPWRHIRPWEE